MFTIYRINQKNVAQCGITTFITQKSPPRTRPNLCGMDSSFCSWPCCAGLLAICHWQWRAVCAATAVSMGTPSLGSRNVSGQVHCLAALGVKAMHDCRRKGENYYKNTSKLCPHALIVSLYF